MLTQSVSRCECEREAVGGRAGQECDLAWHGMAAACSSQSSHARVPSGDTYCTQPGEAPRPVLWLDGLCRPCLTVRPVAVQILGSDYKASLLRWIKEEDLQEMFGGTSKVGWLAAVCACVRVPWQCITCRPAACMPVFVCVKGVVPWAPCMQHITPYTCMASHGAAVRHRSSEALPLPLPLQPIVEWCGPCYAAAGVPLAA